MKRWLLFFLATVAAGLLTRMDHTGTDVATLEPVQILYIDRRGGEYLVSTDTGQQGRGNTAAKAIQNLKQTSPGKIFLETAEHLLVAPAAQGSIPRFAPYLRPDCSVTLAQGEPDMEQAGQFLSTHHPGITLNDYRAGKRTLSTLHTRKGEMTLEKP